MNDRGLSRLQQQILCAIWHACQTSSWRGHLLNDKKTDMVEHWGVRWSGLHVEVKRRSMRWDGSGQSASQRAADARALRRLCDRGLVSLNRRFVERYTDYVNLTEEGKAVAQRLTLKNECAKLTVMNES